jgi:hypothetical protein
VRARSLRARSQLEGRSDFEVHALDFRFVCRGGDLPFGLGAGADGGFVDRRGVALGLVACPLRRELLRSADT